MCLCVWLDSKGSESSINTIAFVSLLADGTVSSFATENMQSDSESQRDTEMERKQKGRDNLCACVCVCGLLLRMPACASDISVLHLIAGADGSIKTTCAVPPPFIPVRSKAECSCRGVLHWPCQDP